MAEPVQPSEIAREALRRLAARRLQPTPDNYRDLYHDIAGTPPAEPFPDRALKSMAAALPRETAEQERFARQLEAAAARRDWDAIRSVIASVLQQRESADLHWAELIRALLFQLERNHAEFSRLRKHEALEQTLTGWGRDAAQLYQRLQSLVKTWSLAPQERGVPAPAPQPLARGGGATAEPAAPEIRELIALVLENGINVFLADEPALAAEASAIAEDLKRGANPPSLHALSGRLKQLVYRLQWVAEDQGEIRAGLQQVLRLIVENIGELVVDDKWLQGQVAMLRDLLARSMNARHLDDVARRLRDLIARQSNLKKSLNEARDRLKELIAQFIERLSGFTESTDEYHARLERCSQRIGAATDIAQLSGIVDEVMRETRRIQLSAERSRDELRQAKARVEEAEREVMRLQEELARTSELVRQDHLTGALNRRGFDEALECEVARGGKRRSPPCLALLDVDDFRRINAAYGRPAGDAALVHLAQVVRDTLRPQDTVGRYDGESFAIVMPDIALDDAVAVLTRLQRELTRRFFLHDNERILITFSAGVTRGDDAGSPATLLSQAEAAMREAKRAGKNRVVKACASA